MQNMDNFTQGTPPVNRKPINLTPKKVAALIFGGIVLVFLIVTVVGSFYTLNAGEEAVVTRFNKYIKTVSTPGLQWKIPYIDDKKIVNMEGIRRLEFGFRSEGNVQNSMSNESLVYGESQSTIDAEAHMLTGDECIVIADWAIMYQVKNSYNFEYKVEDVVGTLRIICESTYRRVVASHTLDDILTNLKDQIQFEIKTDLQEICDLYELGITITGVELQDAQPPAEVNDAFLDVTSAREERASKINEARRYENEKLPTARGEAARLINEAESYKAKRVNEALGSVSRYSAIEAEYSTQPEIMQTRLYLEMITQVLPKVKNVYFVNETGNMMQFLPLTGSTALPK